ncbi:MAG: MFS transporter [Phenylobacterium sp.]
MARIPFLAKVYGFRFFDGFVLIYPLYTVMWVQGGLSPSQVATALTAWSITGIFLQIPSGLLADRWPRRWLLAAGQIARGVGFVIWIVWPGFLGFTLGMMLWGAKSAFTNGVFEALVYDELHATGRADEYPQVIGRCFGAVYAAVMLTSLLAAAMAPLGYQAILAASVGMSLVAAGAALALPQARRTLQIARPHPIAHLVRGFRTVARTPLVLGLIGFAALSQAFGGGLEGFWQIFGRQAGLPLSLVALFGAAVGAAQIGGSTLAHRAGSRGGAARFYGLFGLAGLLLATAAATFQPWSVVLVIFVAALFKVTDVNFDAQLHHAIPTESRATIASVKSFAGQVVMTVMLMSFGALAQGLSYRMAFLGAGLALVAIAAAYGLAGLRKTAI